MTQDLDKISQHFGTETGITIPEKPSMTDSDVKDLTKSLVEKKKLNQNGDYDGARTNLRELITETMSLLPNVVSLTREAESSGMYLAAAAFIKMIAELNKDLLNISETKDSASPKAPPIPETPKPENTTVFIGTSEEIFKQLSKRRSQNATDGEFQILQPVEQK